MDSTEFALKYRSSYGSKSSTFQEKEIYWFSIQRKKTYVEYQRHKAVILFSFKTKEGKCWAYSFTRYQGESYSITMPLVVLDI